MEECFSSVSLKLLRGWISACMRSMSLLGFGTMLANFHMCSIMLVLRTVFHMLVRNANPRGPSPMCFGALCLICQHPVSCYFYFVLLSLGPELW